MRQLFSPPARHLLKYSRQLGDLAGVSELLSWDQETYMPPKGADNRAHQLATLAAQHHEILTSMPLTVFNLRSANSYDLALLREMKRDYDKAVKLPQSLVAQISRAASLAIQSWKRAKAENKFSLFSPDLSQLLGLKIQAAKLLLKKGQSVYDVMLDDFEPDLTAAEVERVFSQLKPQLVKLAAQLAPITRNADRWLTHKKYDPSLQWEFGLRLAKAMGYNLDAGRQDKSAHPATFEFSSSSDVRITNWIDVTDLRPNLFAAIHETGHALYEQGVDPRLDRTHLNGGSGLVIHESQSRLWENTVGRSTWFWHKFYPQLKRTFPRQLRSTTPLAFVKAINVVRPSLIRVEADEVTYGLHIIARFELEKELVRGKLQIKDLPRAWNKKYQELLGIQVPSDRMGVLQDIHWSHGAFGYFPTYLLGTLAAAQIWHTFETKQARLANRVKSGELLVLREWLRSNIHHTGQLYRGKDLLVRVTGESLNPAYFLAYLENKFGSLYNLRQ